MGNCHSSDPDPSETSKILNELAEDNLLFMQALAYSALHKDALGPALKLFKVADRTESFYRQLQTDREESLGLSLNMNTRQFEDFKKVMVQEEAQLRSANTFLKKKYKEVFGGLRNPSGEALRECVASLQMQSRSCVKFEKVRTALRTLRCRGGSVDTVATELDNGRAFPRENALVNDLCRVTTFLFSRAEDRVEYPKIITDRDRLSGRTRPQPAAVAEIRKKLTLAPKADDRRRVQRAYTTR